MIKPGNNFITPFGAINIVIHINIETQLVYTLRVKRNFISNHVCYDIWTYNADWILKNCEFF